MFKYSSASTLVVFSFLCFSFGSFPSLNFILFHLMYELKDKDKVLRLFNNCKNLMSQQKRYFTSFFLSQSFLRILFLLSNLSRIILNNSNLNFKCKKVSFNIKICLKRLITRLVLKFVIVST